MRNARGHELQFATNHLGHFQLTGRLWPAVKNAQGARVVTLSSIGHMRLTRNISLIVLILLAGLVLVALAPGVPLGGASSPSRYVVTVGDARGRCREFFIFVASPRSGIARDENQELSRPDRVATRRS